MRLLPWVALFLVSLPIAEVAADHPARLETIDPLTLPEPEMRGSLHLPSDQRVPEQKVVAPLWAKAVATSPGETIKVIVTLHSSALSSGTDDPGHDRDQRRVQAIAIVAHRFARRARILGMTRLRGLSHLPVVFGTISPAKLAELAALPEVYAVEEDLPIRASRLEGGALIKSPQLRSQLGGNGNGIGVAVIDSGVDATHPELATRVVAQGDYTGTTGDGTIDGTGHGTSVAGIVAGTSGGMAPQARIWALKVFDNMGQGNSSWGIAALNDAYANRNEFGGLHVVNLSLGVPGVVYNSVCDNVAPSAAAAVNQLVSAGIAVFAASGNDGFVNGVQIPACLSGTIAVGAVYDANLGSLSFENCADPVTQIDQITCYSDSGIPLDILAPSHCARTASPSGGYNQCFGGTSAATPYAAGVAAQILSLRPNTTPQALRTALSTTGRPITDVNQITRNRIDALAAYQSLAGGGPTDPCVPSDTTLCIDGQAGDRRFKVQMQYTNASSSGAAHAIPLSSLGVTSGGLFWIGRQGNPEMLIKILNACVPPFNQFWVFYAATTNQGLVTTVTDTQTGRVWSRSNPQGTAAVPVQDTNAFPCN